MKMHWTAATLLTLCVATTSTLEASSHREAPGVLRSPQVDATDFYMFRSYEPGREGFVTLIANYNPLQDPYGGPNYFPLDDDAVYDIHITNDGDATEDITFRFRFRQDLENLSLEIGDEGATETVAVPLVNIGPFGPAAGGQENQNVKRRYAVEVIRGPLNAPTSSGNLAKADTGATIFTAPFDYIGTKSIPDYEGAAAVTVYDVTIPGCDDGKLFAGQRKDSFAVNLGEVFDLVNVTDPLGGTDVEADDLADKNVTSLALEIPISCLTDTSDIVAGWTTAKLPRERKFILNPSFDTPDDQSGPLAQVSRLANPLVNEVAIGLPDKNAFNASHPTGDAQFLTYVTHPSLAELLEILFADAGVEAPNNFPRDDLSWVFLSGIPGVNEDGSFAELMRLNTAIAATPKDDQNNLGVAAGDNAGYPNGRRPGDDVVDISLRAMMGLLCHLGLGVCEPADAPSGLLPFTDGTLQSASQFDDQFPYVTTPIPGSPNATP